jgi:hypothetical protein
LLYGRAVVLLTMGVETGAGFSSTGSLTGPGAVTENI